MQNLLKITENYKQLYTQNNLKDKIFAIEKKIQKDKEIVNEDQKNALSTRFDTSAH